MERSLFCSVNNEVRAIKVNLDKSVCRECIEGPKGKGSVYVLYLERSPAE